MFPTITTAQIGCISGNRPYISYNNGLLLEKLKQAKNNRNPRRDQLMSYNGKVFYHETKENNVWELDLYKCKIKSLGSCVTITKSPLVQVRLVNMILLLIPTSGFDFRCFYYVYV